MFAPDAEILPLEALSRGQGAQIYDITGDEKTVHRLAEMGIRTGSQVIVKEAGEPMRLSVDGREVLLRCGASVMILVSSEFSASAV
jgi:Fe2+ transport system protein FeoA